MKMQQYQCQKSMQNCIVLHECPESLTPTMNHAAIHNLVLWGRVKIQRFIVLTKKQQWQPYKLWQALQLEPLSLLTKAQATLSFFTVSYFAVHIYMLLCNQIDLISQHSISTFMHIGQLQWTLQKAFSTHQPITIQYIYAT